MEIFLIILLGLSIFANLLFLILRSEHLNKMNDLMSSNEKISKKLTESKDASDSLKSELSRSISSINSILSENKSLKSNIDSLRKSQRKIFEIQEGDKILISQSLNHTPLFIGPPTDQKKEIFDVLFECDVISVTETKLKLKAIGMTSDSKYAMGIKNECIAYFQNKWENREKCELIIEQKHRRDSKLDELINT